MLLFHFHRGKLLYPSIAQMDNVAILLTCRPTVLQCLPFLCIRVNSNAIMCKVTCLEQLSNAGDGDSDTGCNMLQRIRRRRARKAALHASLKNPKDLFWDAVWIQPEDIIREVN